ncbi:MAG: fructose-bisphosphatase class III, partial [Ruthenibacterium sp.]
MMAQITEQKYLAQLAREYPNIAAASTEIINLQAILKLPKPTEHFMSDLHGEYEAFTHILGNASGVVREKVDRALAATVPEKERAELATLIYYPAQKLAQLKPTEDDLEAWYRTTLFRLVDVCRMASSKYTRSFVRKRLPKDFDYIIDELLHAH